jgi:hypothetical protein
MYTNTDYTEVLLIYGEARRMQERLVGCINNVPKQASPSSHDVFKIGEVFA